MLLLGTAYEAAAVAGIELHGGRAGGVLAGLGSDDTCLLGDVGIVAAAHQLVVDDDLVVEVDGGQAWLYHAAAVAAAEERTEERTVVLVHTRVVALSVKHDAGHLSHGGTVHVFGKRFRIGQVEGAEVMYALVRTDDSTGIGSQRAAHRGVYHELAIVAQKHVVGIGMRANLQLGHVAAGSLLQQGRTVATHVDGTADDGLLRLAVANDAQRYLLHVGTEGVEGIDRRGSTVLRRVVVEVAPDDVVLQLRIVGIGIRAVAAAVHVAADARVDTHGRTAEDVARDVVAAIDVVDAATAHQDAGRQVVWEPIGVFGQAQGHVQVVVRHGEFLHTVAHRTHVGHAAAAIGVGHFDSGGLRYLEQDARIVGHVALVAAAVQVTDLAGTQVPCRDDGHLGLVVAAEDTQKVVAGLKGGEVQTHLDEAQVDRVVDAVHIERLTACIVVEVECHACRKRTFRGDGTRIVDADDGLFRDGGIVATVEHVAVDAAAYVDVAARHLGLGQRCRTGREHRCRDSAHHRLVVIAYDAVFAVVGILAVADVLEGIVTVAAAEHLTYIDVVGLRCRV